MVYVDHRRPHLCGPDEIIEIRPMPYDGEAGSDTPRLHQAVPLWCCAQVDQPAGQYSTGRGTVELKISASGSAQLVRSELHWVCLQHLL